MPWAGERTRKITRKRTSLREAAGASAAFDSLRLKITVTVGDQALSGFLC
jgi:hypothetical protein